MVNFQFFFVKREQCRDFVGALLPKKQIGVLSLLFLFCTVFLPSSLRMGWFNDNDCKALSTTRNNVAAQVHLAKDPHAVL